MPPTRSLWVIYAAVQTGSDWLPLTVAFGYSFITANLSSFAIEALGLELVVNILHKIVL